MSKSHQWYDSVNQLNTICVELTLFSNKTHQINLKLDIYLLVCNEQNGLVTRETGDTEFLEGATTSRNK